MSTERADSIGVEVAYCPGPGAGDVVALRLTPGATLADALQASGLLQRHGLDAATLRVGIWGKQRAPTDVLRERDRIEIYRPLIVDPKEARRLRYRQHRDKQAAAALARPAAVKPGPAGGSGNPNGSR